MKKILIALGIVGVLAFIIVASARQVSRRGEKVYEEEAKKVESIISTVKASGEIQPKIYVNISSQVPGEIVDLNVKEGDHVRHGDVLLQLDPKQYQSTVGRLEANLKLSRINLDRERTSLTTYESTMRREESLAKSGIVSPEAHDQTLLLVERSRIELRGLEQQVLQAEADLVKAKDELQKTTIRAPIEGLVTRVNAKLGEQVIIGTMNNPGTVILVLSDMSEMLAEVKVDETEVADIRPGQKAVVSVDAIEERKYDGDVTEIAHTALKERDVSRFAVKVSLSASPEHSGPAADRELPLKGVPDPAGGALAELRPGMTAHAAIHVALKKDALVVPIQAVIEKKRKDLEAEKKKGESSTADGSVASETPKPEGTGRNDVAIADEAVDVLFVDRAGKVEMLEVKTGLSDEFNVEILGSPLQAGDKVVIGPYRTLKKLKNGDAIVRVEKDEDLKKDES